MKNLFKPFLRLWIRLYYPVSTPEDLATDLGFDISHFIPFNELIAYLINPLHRPSKLSRFMPREDAEKIFHFALRKERFGQNTFFSYYFKGSWMEFILYFDDQSQLRRVYVRHKDLKQHEIPISS